MTRLNSHLGKEERRKIEITGIINKIKVDCKPFIKELKRTGDILLRGITSTNKNFIIKKPRGAERKPRDTPIKLHNFLNKEFKRKFGWSPREGIFTSFNESVAEKYGDIYIFFPVGNYKYLFSNEYPDLYEHLDDMRWVIPYFEDLTSSEMKIENTYNEMYGEKERNGQWYYKDKKTGRKHFKDALKAKGFKDSDDINYNDFVWVPDKTFDEFKKEKMDEIIEIVRDTIDTYETTGLDNVNMDVEVSFNCKEYYLVSHHYFEDEIRKEFL